MCLYQCWSVGIITGRFGAPAPATAAYEAWGLSAALSEALIRSASFWTVCCSALIVSSVQEGVGGVITTRQARWTIASNSACTLSGAPFSLR
jgi:hypothetical protein